MTEPMRNNIIVEFEHDEDRVGEKIETSTRFWRTRVLISGWAKDIKINTCSFKTISIFAVNIIVQIKKSVVGKQLY